MNTTSTLKANFSTQRRLKRASVLTILANKTLVYPDPFGRIVQNTIACSTSGSHFLFCASGSIYNSSDFGSTIALTTLPSGIFAVAISSSGQYQAAVSTGSPTCIINMSNNFGVTWVAAFTVGPNSGRYTECVCIDSTGQYVFAGGGGSAGLRNYLSTDFGVTFKQVNPLLYRNSCAFNDITKKVVYFDYYNGRTCNVLMTANPLAETIMIPNVIAGAWSITIDSTGDKIAFASRSTSNIAYSLDAGLTYTTKPSPWFFHIMYTGSVLWGNLAASIQKSVDNGTTWTIVIGGLPTTKSFCVSKSMTYIFIVFVDGNIGCYNL